MRFFQINKVLFILTLLTSQIVYADDNNPCAGAQELLALIDRPSKADSACTVPLKKLIAEMGYQYVNLTSGAGVNQNFPELQLRLGLPYDTEVTAILPNYNVQTTSPRTGYNATAVGLKHEIGIYGKWLPTIEGLLILPTGSAAYGSDHYGGFINGILNYSINNAWTLVVMLGVSSETLPHSAGGTKFSSFNPDVLISYQVGNSDIYAEVYGQTNAGPGLGAGYNFDAGILYQFIHSMEVDFSFGQSLYGQLGGFNNYVAVGAGFLIG